MITISARIAVAVDGTISGHTSAKLPAGEHAARISVVDKVSGPPSDETELPSHDVGPWPEALSLRREDMYGDEGR